MLYTCVKHGSADTISIFFLPTSCVVVHTNRLLVMTDLIGILQYESL